MKKIALSGKSSGIVTWESIRQTFPSKTIMIRANTNQNLKSKHLYVSRSCPKCVRKMEKGLLEISYKIPLRTANVWHFCYYLFPPSCFAKCDGSSPRVKRAKNGLSCPPTPILGWRFLVGLKRLSVLLAVTLLTHHSRSLLQKFRSRQRSPGFWSSFINPIELPAYEKAKRGRPVKLGPQVCARFLSASCFLKRHRLHEVITRAEHCWTWNISIKGMSILIINPKKGKEKIELYRSKVL